MGGYVSREELVLKTSLALPVDAIVSIALTYQNGDLALFGEGRVLEHRTADLYGGPGLVVQIAWSAECRELVDWLHRASLPLPPDAPHYALAADLSISSPTPLPEAIPSLDISDTNPTQYLRMSASTDDLYSPVADLMSGEVTPLARIDLSPTPPHGVEAVDRAELYRVAIQKKREKRTLPPKSERIIGIDLGTTYSCAAVVEDGKARVIPSRRGANTVPSVVLIHPEGKTIVGEPALRKQALFPANTLVGVKRLVGRPYHSPVVQSVRERFAYEIVEGEDGEAAVLISKHRISLEEISALILKEIRDSASLALGENVNRAVITCPAHYNERQRAAVRVAGELAGFHVERILSEPTAAALAYGLRDRKERRRSLIYDLGGGTFDASLMEIEGNVFSVLATGGDTFLGGSDFDACIVELLLQHLRDRYQREAANDPLARTRLLLAAEEAKRELSERYLVKVSIPHFVIDGTQPFHFEMELDRDRVDAIFDPLVERTLICCMEVCERAKIAPAAVDEIIVVGGQSRSPIVQRRVAEMFGKQVRRDVHPDEAVAIGAASYAAGMGTFAGVVLVDTLSISIGVGLPGGAFHRILPRDTNVPAKRSHRVELKPGQHEVEVAVFQGEEEDVWSNELAGLMRIANIGHLKSINVQFELTEECMLRLTAVDERTGRILPSEIVFRATPEELRARLEAVSPSASNPDFDIRTTL